MRSVRFCKTILNRLGTYDKGLDAWRGKFPTNAEHRMYLERYYYQFSITGDNARVSVLTPDNMHRHLNSPAQDFRRILWGITRTVLEIVPNQKPLLYHGLTMYAGFPRVCIDMHIGERKYLLSLRSPITLEIYRDACKDPNLWPLFLDSVVDHERGGERFAKLFNQSQYGCPERKLELESR